MDRAGLAATFRFTPHRRARYDIRGRSPPELGKMGKT